MLLLGGTGEGRRLARACHALPLRLVTSVAGLTDGLALPGEVRRGGFGGAAGLAAYLREEHIDLVLDATHPYAESISRHAARAARSIGCPIWALRRPSWRPGAGDDWRSARDWGEVLAKTSLFRTVLFTIGREPLVRYQDKPPGQRWIARTLERHPDPASGITVRVARPPFSLAEELELLASENVDVLVSKNSGGQTLTTKLAAARDRRIPVVMLERPELPGVDRAFDDVEQLLTALRAASSRGLDRTAPSESTAPESGVGKSDPSSAT